MGITGCESRFTGFTGFKLFRWSVPPGKNQSACWMIGSMMPTICRDNVVIISVMFLQRRDERTEEAQSEGSGVTGETGQRLRLGVGPKQAGAEDNGHVAGGHLVGILVLAEFG